jgi:hypothetical protein
MPANEASACSAKHRMSPFYEMPTDAAYGSAF